MNHSKLSYQKLKEHSDLLARFVLSDERLVKSFTKHIKNVSGMTVLTESGAQHPVFHARIILGHNPILGEQPQVQVMDTNTLKGLNP
jgi:hypothetical protein